MNDILRKKAIKDLLPFIEISKALTSTLNPREVLEIIMKEISELFKPRTWSLLLVDEPKNELYFEIAIGPNSEKLKKIRLKVGEGIAGWVAQHGEPVITNNPYEDERFYRKVDESLKFKTQSIIAVPLKSKGKVLGVIELINEPTDERFTKDDLILLQTFSDFAAIAIENARYVEKIKELTIKDDVTKLYNSRYLQEALDREISRARRHNRKLSIIFIDIDHFKHVNDTYGHLVGSKVLAEFGELLRNSLREIDIPTRYGGDEYVIILPETDKEGARKVAERIREKLKEHTFLENEDYQIKITASFGIATYPDDALEKLDLLRLADNAMYRVKETTRDGIKTA